EKQNIEQLENKVVHLSFIKIVQRQAYKTLPRTGTIPCMIIKPKKNQSIDKTKQDLRNNINPAELKVGIRGARGTNNGGMLIRCDKADVEVLKSDMTEKFKDYDIQITSLKKPS
ncbi:hypothetical protein WA026_017724, partial [Henosepilachna vigintioctopunctata]